MIHAADSSLPLALAARKLCVSPDGVWWLGKITLEVPYGRRVAITGDNGAGKTTLLTALAGIRRRWLLGQLTLLDQPAGAGVSEKQLAPLRRRIGFLFQQALVELDSTCWQNVAAMAVIRGVPRGERRCAVRRALERVGLAHRARHRAATLNGGDKRLLALARALVGTAGGILFCDEPTANLSRQAAERLRQLLIDLAESEHYTILVVTHDIRWAEQLAEDIYRLDQGQLRAVRVHVPARPRSGKTEVDTQQPVRKAKDTRRKAAQHRCTKPRGNGAPERPAQCRAQQSGGVPNGEPDFVEVSGRLVPTEPAPGGKGQEVSDGENVQRVGNRSDGCPPEGTCGDLQQPLEGCLPNAQTEHCRPEEAEQRTLPVGCTRSKGRTDEHSRFDSDEPAACVSAAGVDEYFSDEHHGADRALRG